MTLIHFLTNIDDFLLQVLRDHSHQTDLILCILISAEIGFMLIPFLPGDFFPFSVGALAATSGVIPLWVVVLGCIIGVFLGNTINYTIGRILGVAFLEKGRIPFVKKEQIIKTHLFYEKHGNKAVILGRFFPVVRAFIPFVAGIGKMDFKKFLVCSIIGAVLWAIPYTFAGYYFGKNAFVKSHFEIIILAIVAITLLPTLIGIAYNRRKQD